MKCFHFTNGDGRDEEEGEGVVHGRSSRVSWARSLSIASSTGASAHLRRCSSEFVDCESRSQDLGDSVSFHEFLTHRRSNDLRVFTFAELRSATRGFSRALLIGEGGFGSVFRGAVRVSGAADGCTTDTTMMDVAIKQLNRNGFQGHKEWINEVNWLGVIKHPNLVKLVGYCAEEDERGMQRLLVYELMRNKSLEDHLLTTTRVSSSTLPWMARLKIVQDAARGLAYLHEEMDFQLIFRDFKTSNILLDEELHAKLSDFGLARLGPAEGFDHVSTLVVGTAGYAAPEYVQTGKLTAKSDVWSFGVVLYELITGRRALERNLPRSEQNLLEWVKPYVSDAKKFHVIVDSRLEGQYCIKSAQRLALLANKCLTKQPKARPKMSEVVGMLGDIINHASSSKDEFLPETAAQAVEEAKSVKQGSDDHLKQVLDIKDMINLRTKSLRKLDFRNWTRRLVRSL
ncbi:hypothetical protein Dimus_009141 [Dionaea muscipula]